MNRWFRNTQGDYVDLSCFREIRVERIPEITNEGVREWFWVVGYFREDGKRILLGLHEDSEVAQDQLDRWMRDSFEFVDE